MRASGLVTRKHSAAPAMLAIAKDHTMRYMRSRWSVTMVVRAPAPPGLLPAALPASVPSKHLGGAGRGRLGQGLAAAHQVVISGAAPPARASTEAQPQGNLASIHPGYR